MIERDELRISYTRRGWRFWARCELGDGRVVEVGDLPSRCEAEEAIAIALGRALYPGGRAPEILASKVVHLATEEDPRP